MNKTALILRHVHFEDLGSFAEPLTASGYTIRYSDVGDMDFCKGDPCSPDLLIILGGPIGVYDGAYPFLGTEMDFVRARLSAGLPTLGICLGAQLIAAALGERVFPTGIKEIGFSKLALTEAGRSSPLRRLKDVAVLHWHGDTYSLPLGAVDLASSDLVEQQAFSIGSNILGLQFHPEAETDKRFERWLVGHAVELATAKVNPSSLRQDARKYGPRLREAARLMLRDWLDGLEARS
ncbi:glutamine amidotransferase [Rhizobium leguminosarum]|uniref:glutamine amidotransferase n=1 Tax=Rhizobium leguminosarum TaxID=384 RepID=UPI0014424999|nr:glutamine amidotransferase [Rhizobium leguminosarum]NKL00235.1 glutamine amidotransferase [Rhizobium leguminosarum bv. viciae]NKL81254.1 glutamine amidotransferase [Rhizobium leguminosarum bv. viciae]